MGIQRLVIIRGGGDLATGVIQKFYRAGLPVLVLESPAPSAIRRTVSLCEAVYNGKATVEDMACRLIVDDEEILQCHREGVIPLMIDPAGDAIKRLSPMAVVDAIIAKRNLGTHRDMAPVVVALGPGFTAGQDAHAVIETMRGHNLGRVILEGSALPNTGTPGLIGGESTLRVIHSPASGPVRHLKKLGDVVEQGEGLFAIGDTVATAPIAGRLRGLIREGFVVHEGMKTADIDPRTNTDWLTISDKARCIGGGALEAVLMLERKLEV